jgi:hypothetical protein
VPPAAFPAPPTAEVTVVSAPPNTFAAAEEIKYTMINVETAHAIKP